MMKKRSYAAGLIFGIACLYILYIGKPIIMPFVLAVFIWYMVKILTDALARPMPFVRVKLPHPIAFAAALVTITAAIYMASLIIISNISEVAGKIPAYQYNLEQMSRRLLAYIPMGEQFSLNNLLSGIDVSSLSRAVVGEVTGLFGKVAIVAVYLLFIFLEQGSFKGKLEKLIPDDANRREVEDIIKRIDSDIHAYVGIKTIASAVTATLSYIVMASVDLNFASFWAFVVFIFNFIPTFGSIAATALPSLFALMQFPTLGPFFVVLAGVGGLQLLIGNILEPRFQGDRLNLSPIVILVSLALWNLIWGIPGMFLCVPLTAITTIVFSHFPQTRSIAIILSRAGKIKEAESPLTPAQ